MFNSYLGSTVTFLEEVPCASMLYFRANAGQAKKRDMAALVTFN